MGKVACPCRPSNFREIVGQTRTAENTIHLTMQNDAALIFGKTKKAFRIMPLSKVIESYPHCYPPSLCVTAYLSASPVLLAVDALIRGKSYAAV